jgi:DNA-binding response OmpR family regulator
MALSDKLILAIDDEESILLLLRKRLESAGYTVDTANNGRDGLLKARTIRPSLIILDIMLPGIDGYKICQMLKFDENFSDIPIILLTARNQEQDKITGMKTGANLYITKSFSPEFWDNLLKNIQNLLTAI